MAFLIGAAVRMGVGAVKQGVQAHKDVQNPERAEIQYDRNGNIKAPGPVYNFVRKTEEKRKLGKAKAQAEGSSAPHEHEQRQGDEGQERESAGGRSEKEEEGKWNQDTSKTDPAPPSYNEATTNTTRSPQPGGFGYGPGPLPPPHEAPPPSSASSSYYRSADMRDKKEKEDSDISDTDSESEDDGHRSPAMYSNRGVDNGYPTRDQNQNQTYGNVAYPTQGGQSYNNDANDRARQYNMQDSAGRPVVMDKYALKQLKRQNRLEYRAMRKEYKLQRRAQRRGLAMPMPMAGASSGGMGQSDWRGAQDTGMRGARGPLDRMAMRDARRGF